MKNEIKDLVEKKVKEYKRKQIKVWEDILILCVITVFIIANVVNTIIVYEFVGIPAGFVLLSINVGMICYFSGLYTIFFEKK